MERRASKMSATTTTTEDVEEVNVKVNVKKLKAFFASQKGRKSSGPRKESKDDDPDSGVLDDKIPKLFLGDRTMLISRGRVTEDEPGIVLGRANRERYSWSKAMDRARQTGSYFRTHDTLRSQTTIFKEVKTKNLLTGNNKLLTIALMNTATAIDGMTYPGRKKIKLANFKNGKEMIHVTPIERVPDPPEHREVTRGEGIALILNEHGVCYGPPFCMRVAINLLGDVQTFEIARSELFRNVPKKGETPTASPEIRYPCLQVQQIFVKHDGLKYKVKFSIRPLYFADEGVKHSRTYSAKGFDPGTGKDVSRNVANFAKDPGEGWTRCNGPRFQAEPRVKIDFMVPHLMRRNSERKNSHKDAQFIGIAFGRNGRQPDYVVSADGGLFCRAPDCFTVSPRHVKNEMSFGGIHYDLGFKHSLTQVKTTLHLVSDRYYDKKFLDSRAVILNQHVRRPIAWIPENPYSIAIPIKPRKANSNPIPVEVGIEKKVEESGDMDFSDYTTIKKALQSLYDNRAPKVELGTLLVYTKHCDDQAVARDGDFNKIVGELRTSEKCTRGQGFSLDTRSEMHDSCVLMRGGYVAKETRLFEIGLECAFDSALKRGAFDGMDVDFDDFRRAFVARKVHIFSRRVRDEADRIKMNRTYDEAVNKLGIFFKDCKLARGITYLSKKALPTIYPVREDLLASTKLHSKKESFDSMTSANVYVLKRFGSRPTDEEDAASSKGEGKVFFSQSLPRVVKSSNVPPIFCKVSRAPYSAIEAADSSFDSLLAVLTMNSGNLTLAFHYDQSTDALSLILGTAFPDETMRYDQNKECRKKTGTSSRYRDESPDDDDIPDDSADGKDVASADEDDESSDESDYDDMEKALFAGRNASSEAKKAIVKAGAPPDSETDDDDDDEDEDFFRFIFEVPVHSRIFSSKMVKILQKQGVLAQFKRTQTMKNSDAMCVFGSVPAFKSSDDMQASFSPRGDRSAGFFFRSRRPDAHSGLTSFEVNGEFYRVDKTFGLCAGYSAGGSRMLSAKYEGRIGRMIVKRLHAKYGVWPCFFKSTASITLGDSSYRFVEMKDEGMELPNEAYCDLTRIIRATYEEAIRESFVIHCGTLGTALDPRALEATYKEKVSALFYTIMGTQPLALTRNVIQSTNYEGCRVVSYNDQIFRRVSPLLILKSPGNGGYLSVYNVTKEVSQALRISASIFSTLPYRLLQQISPPEYIANPEPDLKGCIYLADGSALYYLPMVRELISISDSLGGEPVYVIHACNIYAVAVHAYYHSCLIMLGTPKSIGRSDESFIIQDPLGL